MSVIEGEKKTSPRKPVLVIVDDDHKDLERLRGHLRNDFEVHVSSGGREALRLIRGLPALDVLIVDDDMPAMPGAEILRFVQDVLPNPDGIIKVLLLSSPGNGDRSEPVVLSAVDFRGVKPIDPAALGRKIRHLVAKRSREKRAAWRVTLNEPGAVRVEAGPAGDAKVVNISETGIFLRTLSFFPEGATIPLKIMLPDGRQYAVTGRIARHDFENGGVGVEFQSLDESDRGSLLKFMSDYVTARDLPELKRRYPFLRTDDMVVFQDRDRIEALLREALDRRLEIAAIQAHSKTPEILEMTEVQPPSVCMLSGKNLDRKFKTSDLLFLSFQIGYSTYNFETMVCRLAPDGNRMICLYPKVLFYSEKRSSRRFNANGNLRLEIALPPPFEKPIRGKITDISPEGVSIVAEAGGPALLTGTPLDRLKIYENDRLLWEESGEVRNVARLNGDGRFRYGIQFGIGRMGILTAPILEPIVPAAPEGPADLKHDAQTATEMAALARRSPDIIRLENAKGETITGLLNTSFPLDGRAMPVVVIPPAFGKTKETLFGLALTITQNFRRMGRPIAVLRFDGIRRKGESHKDAASSLPPHEMLKADFSQAVDDLKSVLEWLSLNPRLKAESVILISFSLSALEARILLREDDWRRRVQYWIPCMGTPEFRDLMIRVNCGLDFFEQHRLGIHLGVMPVLGNLVEVDAYVADGVRNGVATLDQARRDMKRIDIPVTWIIGRHDHWVKPEFVRDVMSIRANAPREVVAVPIGHNARTSDEALQLFALLTSLIHRRLHGDLITPVLPAKKDLEVMRRAEKDRLPPRCLSNRRAYWQRYLMGEENHLGFDVMALSDDYRQLMRDQCRALDLQPGDRLLDLGGGTGNFVDGLAESGGLVPGFVLIADLIPEGLKQAFRKLATRFGTPAGPKRFGVACLDVELDRFIPVRRFLDGEIGSFVDLADRIENLSLESAARIQADYSPRLHRLLRGEAMDPAADQWLKSRFELEEYRVILDLHRASRWVRGLRTEPLVFKRLAFGSAAGVNRFLPFRDGAFNKVLMSLVLSYVFNPIETLREIRRIAGDRGRLVLSSMRPDTDASGPFTRLMDKIETMPEKDLPAHWPKGQLLESLRSFLNDAQALVELEEAGTFDFFELDKLRDYLDEAGWDVVETVPSYGDPPQGYVVTAAARPHD